MSHLSMNHITVQGFMYIRWSDLSPCGWVCIVHMSYNVNNAHNVCRQVRVQYVCMYVHMYIVCTYVVERQREGCGTKRRNAPGSRISLSCSQLLTILGCVSLY